MTTSTFGERLAPNLLTDVRKIPSLEEFSPDPPGGSENGRHSEAAQGFFDLVTEICRNFRFTPIIAEFAYLSDLNFVSAADVTIEYGIRSFLASTDDQRIFVSSDSSAYLHAFSKMIERQKETGRSPEPIGGHPNLWQDWFHDGVVTPQAGYIHFPSRDGFYHSGLDVADVKFMPAPPNDSQPGTRPTDANLKLAEVSSNVLKMTEYHSSVEDCFRRFVGYFLQETRAAVEPIPRMIPAFSRLYNSYFLGIPFVRPRSGTNSHIASALSSLNLEPARGTIFMLFLETDEQVEGVPSQIGELARALHALVLEMALKGISTNSTDLISYVGNIVHNAGNFISAIAVDDLKMIFVNNPDQFSNRDRWSGVIASKRATVERNLKKEDKFAGELHRLLRMTKIAQSNLTIVEFKTFGSMLAPKYQQKDDVSFYNAVIEGASEILLPGATAATQARIPKIGFEIQDELVEQIILPRGYLAGEQIIAIVYEALLNCAKHGDNENGTVKVQVSARRVDLQDRMVFEFDFVNRFSKPVEDGRKKGLDSFLNEITLTRSIPCAGSYLQRLRLDQFMMVDKEGRKMGWISLREASK
jgi:hypothetical protein